MSKNCPVEILPASYVSPLDLEGEFGRNAPLEVDVGCGAGSFLVESARRDATRNFLGIERLLARARTVCRKAERTGLGNVRVLRLEIQYALRYLLPPASVAVFHVLFADPWPKRRHHRRRLIQPPFLDTVHAALAPGGELRVKTDDPDYATHISRVISAHPGFRIAPWTPAPDEPLTDFERHFVRRGLFIHRFRLEKT